MNARAKLFCVANIYCKFSFALMISQTSINTKILLLFYDKFYSSIAFDIFSKFCFLTLLPVIKRSMTHQMIIIISKMLIILEYVLAKSVKCSISSGVIHSSTEIITLANKKIKTIYKIKRASFARPRAVCPIIKRFTPSTPKTKLPTQKTIVGDFKLSCGIFETRSFIFVSSKELSLSSNVF